MTTHNVSGVAVVDEAGRLKGVISKRDLKTLGTDMHLFWRYVIVLLPLGFGCLLTPRHSDWAIR